MSDTQTESETDAEPTPGPVTKGVTSNPERRIAKVLKGTDMVGEHNTHCDIHSKRHPIQSQEPVANADLIVAAFNAAQEAREMGYDPQEVVEELSDILRVLESISSIQKGHRHAGHTAAQTAQSKLDALKSAEGSGE